MVNATNVSNWAELIYGDVRIDRRPLVIPVGREVKGGGKRARRDSGGLWSVVYERYRLSDGTGEEGLKNPASS